MSEHDDRLADAVNQEPIVYNDCTQSELMGSIGLGIAVGVTLGIIVGIAIDFIMFGIVIGLMISVGVSWFAMNWIKHIRQKYYLTWFKEKLFLFKRDAGFASGKYIGHSERFGKGARRG
jgi:conjugative transfer region protein (TIGR03750 family)